PEHRTRRFQCPPNLYSRRWLGTRKPCVQRAARFRPPQDQRGDGGLTSQKGITMIDVVQKLWGFCHTLRHDGIGYTEYVEQLTYLLFVKMANEKGIDLSKIEVEELAADRKKRKRTIDCSWPALRDTSGTDIIDRYIDILRALGKQPGTLG